MRVKETITGRRTNDSWEKQTFYALSNGWTAIVSFNQFYGEFVSQLYHKGEKWQACNGIENHNGLEMQRLTNGKVGADSIILPDFARPWLDGSLVRPRFKRV